MRRRRGRGLRNWATRGLALARKHQAFSRGATYLNNKYGARVLGRIGNPIVRAAAQKAVKFGISQLKQRGYGTSRAGGALKRAGGCGCRRRRRRRR